MTRSLNTHTPMNFKPLYAIARASLMLWLTEGAAPGADQVVSQLLKNGGQVELDWHANFQLPVSATFPAYTILRSVDLITWGPVARPVNRSVGVSDEVLRFALPVTGGRPFYPVL